MLDPLHREFCDLSAEREAACRLKGPRVVPTNESLCLLRPTGDGPLAFAGQPNLDYPPIARRGVERLFSAREGMRGNYHLPGNSSRTRYRR